MPDTNIAPDSMTADEFCDWAQRNDLHVSAEIQDALGGLSKAVVSRYRRGRSAVPSPVARLCRFIDKHGVDGWIADDGTEPEAPMVRGKISAYGYRLSSQQIDSVWLKMLYDGPFTTKDVEDFLIEIDVPAEKEGRQLAKIMAQRVVSKAKEVGDIQATDNGWVAIEREGK